MSQMSERLKKATNKAIKLAEEEGMVIVGFCVPKDLDAEGNFGWSLFTSCEVNQANDLICTIGDILRDVDTSTLN
jgi:hypothetical protein